ncbi:MAG: ATP-binding protein [candidate division KSB1 bacterium]|nr:ATP-binding protein [candidate division KSB1 bacterium]MDZ7302195.1 ATP-binding protein [candidate division KSB1 bacterium]MDZ7311304.1 ATP-binding protein [candidate division KSB1 bacterium]
MSITIRSRLTIWFTFAFSGVLIVIAGVLALKFYRQLDRETRRALRTEEAWITMMVKNDFPDSSAIRSERYDSLAGHLHEELDERFGMKPQFLVLTIEGNPPKVLVTGGAKNIERYVPVDFLDRRTGYYNLMVAGDHYSARVFRHEWGGAAVGVQNEIIFKVAKETAKTLMWIAPLAMLLAFAGGWLMAKLALRPVVAAAQAAESISLANLKERLPAYSGKDEFGVLVATLNRMIARLEAGVRRLQQFTQDAAHELRTPLAVMRADTELACQDEKNTEETRAWLQKNLDRLIALGRIVDNLMLLARSDSGDYPIHKTLFRLDAAVKEIFEDLQILAEGKSLSVHLKNCEVVNFLGDQLLIRRLLLNLCDNAMKYTSQGKIELSLKHEGANIEFVIGDTGCGIPSEDLPHIFDRFYRVDKAHSRETGGSGLGLAICQWIVTVHGGTIEIDSKIGKGTSVRVLLPNLAGQE